MSVKSINSVENNRQKRLGVNQQNNKPNSMSNPQFTGSFNPVVTVTDAIARGGFAAEFIAQDGIGMVAPRIWEGMNRGRPRDEETGEKTGPYNWAFARREGIREILSGPSAFIIPAAIMAVIKKYSGKANDVSINMINTMSENFAKIANDNKDAIKAISDVKDAQQTKNVKFNFYKQMFGETLSASLDNAIQGKELDEVSAKMANKLIDIEQAKSKGFFKHFIGKATPGKKEDLTGELVQEFMDLRKKHVAPTANRGDEMSVVGIAREVATIFSRPLNFSKMTCANEIKKPNFEVKIDEEVCKYYAIAVLKDLKVKPSPAWMQRRLMASGVRAISNVVDVTNYVMLEYGQPLHSFDLDKLNNYLEVRRAKEGEKITTLDSEERELNTNSVLIATKEEGVALAGVMGGENSEIDDNTVNIALEAAFFPPVTTRRSAKSVGLRTEANARFERGVDIETVKPALLRAIQLLIELCDAKFEGISEVGNNELPEQLITLRYAQIKRYLGIEIPEDTCVQILESLGFKLCGKNQLAARFSVPGFRAVDVTREIDLIEEVARIYGYDKIEPTLPDKTVAAEIKHEDKVIKRLSNLLLGKGFYEAMTSSLIGKPLYNWAGIDYIPEKSVEVQYSQSEDYTMLRQSMIPSLLNIVKYNFDNGSKNLWFYENGKTYTIEEAATEKTTGVKEKRILCGVVTGKLNTSKWQSDAEVDFYTVKGVIENIFEELKLTQRVVYSACENVKYLHPKRSANAVVLGKNKAPVAIFGQLHPVIKDKLKFNQDIFLFEIDLDALLENVNSNAVLCKELPVYPSVTRDIAFVVKSDVTCQDLSKSIKKLTSPNLFKGADIFDVYQGEHVEAGHKSVAFHVYFQDKNATLTDEIVEAEVLKLKEGLKKYYPSVSFRE